MIVFKQDIDTPASHLMDKFIYKGTGYQARADRVPGESRALASSEL